MDVFATLITKAIDSGSFRLTAQADDTVALQVRVAGVWFSIARIHRGELSA